MGQDALRKVPVPQTGMASSRSLNRAGLPAVGRRERRQRFWKRPPVQRAVTFASTIDKGRGDQSYRFAGLARTDRMSKRSPGEVRGSASSIHFVKSAGKSRRWSQGSGLGTGPETSSTKPRRLQQKHPKQRGVLAAASEPQAGQTCCSPAPVSGTPGPSPGTPQMESSGQRTRGKALSLTPLPLRQQKSEKVPGKQQKQIQKGKHIHT